MRVDPLGRPACLPPLAADRAPPRIAEGVAARFTPERWGGSDGGIGPGVRGVAASGGTVDAALMDRLPDLEIVANYGVGYDNIDAVEAGPRRVLGTNTPDLLNREGADPAI